MKIVDILQSPSFTSKNVLEKLICYRLGLSKEALFTKSDIEVAPIDYERISRSYDEYHTDKKPLEYILGFVEFLGVRFHVTSATLIPRPETEYMIQAVNEHLHTSLHVDQQVTIIDVGTGCGVLGLSVLYHNPHRVKEVFLSELSMDALEVAKKNYTELFPDPSDKPHNENIPITFLESDLVDHPTLTNILQSDDSIVLVANLPYIPDQTFDDNVEDNVKKREPRMAFVGGEDGLDLYRKMLDQIVEARKSVHLTPNDKNTKNVPVNSDTSCLFTMFLEMMTRQVDILRNEYKNVFTFEQVKTFHFNIRMVRVW